MQNFGHLDPVKIREERNSELHFQLEPAGPTYLWRGCARRAARAPFGKKAHLQNRRLSTYVGRPKMHCLSSMLTFCA